MRELESILRRIDGRGYKAYKDLQGRSFHHRNFELRVEHVQGDPYAAPSRIRALVPREVADLPGSSLATPARHRATRDFLVRAFRKAASGHREISIDAGRQTVLDRSACLIDDSSVELRFTVELPGAGRRILGRQAATLLLEAVPAIIETSAVAQNLDLTDLENHASTTEDQTSLREALADRGLVAFVGNGAVLPRRSGIDDRPLTDSVLFDSPKSLEVRLTAPNAGEVVGMGIPRGITLIVGGGFHGKSTLLRAIETGVWDHIPGDGRERVVADPGAVKIRAEDGRAVHAVDISPFISHLPGGRDTREFTTELASGSTSQAAALTEAVEAGAPVVLLDEDTSATNFMIRDRRMQALVKKTAEPITPYVDRIGELSSALGVSTILVMGGSGDYFDHSDLVIQMNNYVPHDVTDLAREVASDFETGRQEEREGEIELSPPRLLVPASLNPERRRGRWKIQARGTDALVFGRGEVDLRAVEQLEDPSQLRSIGWILGRLSEFRETEIHPLPLIAEMIERLTGGEWDWVTGRPDGDLALPRLHEVIAALNRLRDARFTAHGSGTDS